MKIQFLCLWMAVVAGVAMCFGQTSSTTPGNVPANEQAIIDLEKAVTEAYKNKKADVFRNTWRRTMLVLMQMEPRKGLAKLPKCRTLICEITRLQT